MKRARLILLGAVVLVALLGALVTLNRDEPRARGKSLSTWLFLAANSQEIETADEAADAIREIGTNAIPFLMDRLFAKDPEWKTWLMRSVAAEYLPRRWLYRRNREHLETLQGFKILDTQAVSMVPVFERMLQDPIKIGRAAYALGYIGPSAYPALRTLSTNDQSNVRILAALSLAVREDLARVAVPELTQLSDDTNHTVARIAFQGLVEALPEEQSIEMIMASLEHKSPAKQVTALRVFEIRYVGQTSAVPVFVRLLNHTNIEVSSIAARQLARLDPNRAWENGFDTNGIKRVHP